MVKLNETPVRTARNFNINNIKLESINLPKEIGEFKRTKITGISHNVILNHNIEEYNIKYGMGEEFTNEVKNKSNKVLRLDIKENAKINIENYLDKENQTLIDNIEITTQENIKRKCYTKICIK